MCLSGSSIGTKGASVRMVADEKAKRRQATQPRELWTVTSL